MIPSKITLSNVKASLAPRSFSRPTATSAAPSKVIVEPPNAVNVPPLSAVPTLRPYSPTLPLGPA